MRRLAALLAALVAFGIMCLSLPWDSLECLPPDCVSSKAGFYWFDIWTTLLIFGLYVLIPFAILAAVLVAVLRLGGASGPEEAAVRAALGQTRGQAVRLAARRGLADAGVWVGGAYVLAGIAHLVIIAGTGVYPLTQDLHLWLTRLWIAAVPAASLVVAHMIDALRTRRTPVEQLEPEPSEPLERRVPLMRRTAIFCTVAAAGVGILIGTNLAFQGATQAAPKFVIVIASVAAWLVGLAVAGLAWAVLMPLARDAIPRFVGLLGTWSTALGADEVGAVLAARASTRWFATSRVIVVLAGLAFLFGLAAVANPETGTAKSGFTEIGAGVPTGTTGAVSTCDADCVAARASLDGEEGAGAIVPAASSWLGADYSDTSFDSTVHALTFIDPADLDGVDDVLAAALRDEPSVVLMPPTFGSVSIDDFDDLGLRVTGIGALPPEFPHAIANRVWAQAQMGQMDSTYFYVYPPEGWTPDQTYDSLIRTSSDEYTWTIEQGDRSDWVFADGAGASMSGDSASGDFVAADNVDRIMLVQNLVLWTILVALIVVPIAAVATAAVLRRRRDDATMAALGASATTLRVAVVVEATATAALALASGLLGGALTQVAIQASAKAISGLYGVQLNNVLMGAVLGVNWWVLLQILAATLAVFIVVSWIASRSLRTLSPVEALRPVKEGTLR